MQIDTPPGSPTHNQAESSAGGSQHADPTTGPTSAPGILVNVGGAGPSTAPTAGSGTQAPRGGADRAGPSTGPANVGGSDQAGPSTQPAPVAEKDPKVRPVFVRHRNWAYP
jgi:hypothetical protein